MNNSLLAGNQSLKGQVGRKRREGACKIDFCLPLGRKSILPGTDVCFRSCGRSEVLRSELSQVDSQTESKGLLGGEYVIFQYLRLRQAEGRGCVCLRKFFGE